MIRYYLSGPMTGLPEFNYPAFFEAARQLRGRDMNIINPAENLDGNDSLPRSTYMRHDVELLLTCEAIIMLEGWESSKGARLELDIARQIGLLVYELTPDFHVRFFDDELPHEEALNLVHGARGEDYGHPLDDFSKTAKIWSAILSTDVTAEQVALCMVGVKLSREINRPKRDNLVDAHGYLMTYEMVRQERDRRNENLERVTSKAN